MIGEEEKKAIYLELAVCAKAKCEEVEVKDLEGRPLSLDRWCGRVYD